MNFFTPLIRVVMPLRRAGALPSLFLALLLGMAYQSSGQVAVSDNLTAQQLVQRLVGANVATLNPQLVCGQGHSGTFVTSASNLGLQGGIILATSRVKTTGSVVGANAPVGLEVSGPTPAGPGDPDLDVLATPRITNDACVLEFDFVPDVDTTSTLRFNYVFASEEYPEYACSSFNDIFAFLLTGGPYNNTNIALVPGTTLPVTINAINLGPGTAGNAINCTPPGTAAPYSAFYVNNAGQGSNTIAYDGFTTVLEASAVVQPCDTYHIKLAVANVQDNGLQSAVFLQENSFSVDSVELTFDEFITSDDGYLVEGCTPALIQATRSEASNRTRKLCLSYGGTAMPGLDYPALPDTLVIMPGQTTASITLAPFQDGLSEGVETVIIRRLNCCTKDPVDSVSINVRDSLRLTMLSVDTAVCPGQMVRLQVSADTAFDVAWTPSATVRIPTDTFTVANPLETTEFVATALYKSCPPVARSFVATVEPTPIVSILNPDTTVCMSDPFRLRVSVGPSWFTGGWNYVWVPNLYLDDPFAKEPLFFNQDFREHRYVLTAQTPLGCKGSDTSNSIWTRPPLALQNITSESTIRYGDSIRLNVDSGDYYTWSPTFSLDNENIQDPLARPKETTTYTVYAWNRYGCRDTGFVKVNVDFAMNEFIPTAFTPNGDGRNDEFRVFNLRFQKVMEFRVYNRYGQEVFYTADAAQGWNGRRYNAGEPLDMGVYHYFIRTARPDGTAQMYKGDVMLMR